MVGHTPRPRSPQDDADDPPKHRKRLPFALVATEVACNPKLSDQAFRLYVVMATFANIKKRDGFAGRKALAEAMGCSDRKITRLLAELTELDIIEREERRLPTRNGKQRRTTDGWKLLDQQWTSEATRSAARADAMNSLASIELARAADGREPLEPELDTEGWL